jgi:UDP-glucose 4-epimerase
VIETDPVIGYFAQHRTEMLELKRSVLEEACDGVSGIFCAVDRFQGKKGIFNLGHDAFLNVLDLARIVTSELGLDGVEFVTSGGERGWLGDSPVVHLETSRIKELGWVPRISIEEGIRATTRFLMENSRLLEQRN